MHDRTLRGAMARGHWDNTKSILVKGRDWIVEQMKASGLRAVEAPVSNRTKVVIYAEGK